MRFLRNLKIAIKALGHNRSRASLTILGVIIGVAAVMMMLSIGGGAEVAVTGEIKSLGSNLLMVIPGSISSAGIRTGMGSVNTLTLDDAQAISRIPGVEAAVPGIQRQAQVIAGDRNTNTSVMGTSADYQEVLNTRVSAGNFFSPAEVESWGRVALIGTTVKQNLFPDEDPLGKTIQIVNGPRRVSFRVLGVLEAKGATGFVNRDDQILIPITTAQKLLFGVKQLGSITVEVSSPDMMEEVTSEISSLLRIRHNIPQGKEGDFTIFSQKDVLGTLSSVMGYFTIVLAGIASISLLVGGIGIMNIMLVSVTERTREIGLRKAIGALKKDIVLQFLLEAVTLSTTGGIIGILLGYGGSLVIARIAGWPAVITPLSVLLGFFFSMAVGLFFGIYPAQKAASLNPIEALRYE
jgi:putative ABC transport system permease protein